MKWRRASANHLLVFGTSSKARSRTCINHSDHKKQQLRYANYEKTRDGHINR